MLRLYHDHNAVCCQKVEIVLAEKSVEFLSEIVSLFRSEQYSPEYLKINPFGIVPTLVHDQHKIMESTVICEYVDETFPGPKLMPSSPIERAKVRTWTKRVDEQIHEACSVLSFCAMFRDRMLKMPKEEREKRYRNVGDPTRDEMYRSSVENGVTSAGAYRAIAAYELLVRDLESQLSVEGDWITGNAYTLAEVALTPYFARIEYLGLKSLWLAERERVNSWWQRIKTRKSFNMVFKQNILKEDLNEMRASGEKIFDLVAMRRAEFLSNLAKQYEV